MIRLHHFGHASGPFELNPDLILTIEASPDTVVTLTTGTRVLVAETVEEVSLAVRRFRSGVLADALGASNNRPSTLASVR